MKSLKEIKVPLPMGTDKEIRKSVEKAEADLRENMRDIEDSQNETELALGAIGTIITADQTNQTIPNETWQELTRIELPKGTYILDFGSAFASNATGKRWVILARISGGNSNSAFMRGAYDIKNANSNSITVCSGTIVVEIKETETLYLNGYQDSGAVRGAYPWLRAIRIK